MIREASIYDLKKVSPAERSAYGLCILTMRRWPRGLGWNDIDFWMPSAGPSEELLAAWQTALLSWETFVEQYRQEQLNQYAFLVRSASEKRSEQIISLGRSIEHLRRLERNGTITVCCWERSEQCHRFTLVHLVQELAAQEEEINPCH